MTGVPSAAGGEVRTSVLKKFNQNNKICLESFPTGIQTPKVRFQKPWYTLIMFLKSFTDTEVLTRLKDLVKQERELLSEILQHLMIVDERRLHLEEGYSSLFDYAVKVLNYNESQAYRRISAMRVLRELPELKAPIEAGKINLTHLTQAKQFFQTKGKTFEPLSKAEKLNVISHLENKSTRETEKIFAELAPNDRPAEKVRAIAKNITLIQFSASDELMAKLNQFKELDGHVQFNPNYAELFERLVDLALNQKQKVYSKPVKEASPEVSAPKKQCIVKPARAIPIFVKRAVMKRDEGSCVFVNPVTQKRCGSKYKIQFDHKRPFAMGGEHTAENLRIFCSAHNQFAAENSFGRLYISKFNRV